MRTGQRVTFGRHVPGVGGVWVNRARGHQNPENMSASIFAQKISIFDKKNANFRKRSSVDQVQRVQVKIRRIFKWKGYRFIILLLLILLLYYIIQFGGPGVTKTNMIWYFWSTLNLKNMHYFYCNVM